MAPDFLTLAPPPTSSGAGLISSWPRGTSRQRRADWCGVSEYYPKFSLAALLGSATAISSDNLFTSGASQHQSVLGLRWALFDFGRVEAQIAAARARPAESLAPIDSPS